MLIAGFVLFFGIDPKYLEMAKTYKTYQVDPSIDYKAELTAMRQQYMADGDPKKNRPYLFPGKYSYARGCYDLSVLQKGQIQYGMVVKANDKLFRCAGDKILDEKIHR